MDDKRSIGVTIYGVLAILLSIGSLFTFLLVINSFESITNFHEFPKKLLEYSIISAPIFSFLFLISGIGILRLKFWGRNILIGLAVYSLLAKIVMICLGIGQKTPAGRPLGVVVNIIVYSSIIYFFTRPKVKEQFE